MSGVVVYDTGRGPELGWLDGVRLHRLGRSRDDLPRVLAELLDDPDDVAAQAKDEIRDARLLPPTATTSRVIAVAQNYPAHAAEAGGVSPDRPVMFIKPLSAFVGHRGKVRVPPVTRQLDYEAEIAAVLGADVVESDADAAQAAVAGFTLANDGSARDLQPTTLANKDIVDWFSTKSLDRCSALGPAIVPTAQLGDLAALRLEGRLNGDTVQDDVLASAHRGVGELIAFISQRMALQPGDVVLTGTPAGVGKARGRFLTDGDVFTVHCRPLGELTVSIVPS